MRTVKQNSLTPNSKEQVSPKTQQQNLIIVCRKFVMQMKQAQCDQAKWNKTINHGLTIQAITIENWLQCSFTYGINIWTCKLISLNVNYHLHVQHSTNAHNKYASRNKILLGHKSESTWSNAWQNNKYYETRHRYKP